MESTSRRNRPVQPLLYERPERPKLHGYEFWREILKSPKYVLAPMVDASELAYRILVRRYGVTLAYTPMMLSKTVETVLQAARKVERYCEAVDINLGCPQHCARTGGYGAYLMDKPDVVSKIISTLHENLKVPVTAKMRIRPTLEETLAFAKMLEKSGASVIGVHGRTRDQKGKFPCAANWDFIREIKRHVSVPIIANGSIRDRADADACMAYTGADAVMSAWALLENPAVFADIDLKQDIYMSLKLAREYAGICREYQTPRKWQDMHYYQLFRESFARFPEESRRFDKRKMEDDVVDFIAYLEKRWQNPDAQIPCPFGRPNSEALEVQRQRRERREHTQQAEFETAEDTFFDFDVLADSLPSTAESEATKTATVQ